MTLLFAAALLAAASAGEPAPAFRGPALDVAAVDLAVADGQVVLAAKDAVVAYAVGRDTATWEKTCSYALEQEGARFVSVELSGKLVLASLVDELSRRVESLALVCKDGRFEETGRVPWLVREVAPGILGAQRLIDDENAPFSAVRALVAAGGSVAVSSETLDAGRAAWLYGLDVLSSSGPVRTISYAASGEIKLRLARKVKESGESYGQTTNRLRRGSWVLRFSPRLIAARGTEGFSGVYALKALPRAGFLSENLASYASFRLDYLPWRNGQLEPGWSAALPGQATGLAAERGADGAVRALWVSAVDGDGKTSVLKFQP